MSYPRELPGIVLRAISIAIAVFALQVGVVRAQDKPETDSKLLSLAREHFNGDKEQKFGDGVGEEFFTAVAKGVYKGFDHPAGKSDVFEAVDRWPAVKAEWIVWLCTDPDASKLVTYHGIDVSGVRIDGKIDLEGATVPFRIFLRQCSFKSDISIVGAHLQALDLSASRIEKLQADGAQFDRGLAMADEFRANGNVSLFEATIGGDLDCTDGHFNSSRPGGRALNADSAKIAGYALLRSSEKNGRVFESNGELRFLKATIGGDLDCSGGHLNNPKGSALDAQGAKIGGNARLNERMKVQGDINLLGAQISGYLVWKGVTLSDGAGLHLESATCGTLQDEPESWPKAHKVYLDGFVYNRISGDAPRDAVRRLDWLERMPGKHFFPQPYQQLATVLKNADDDDSATEVLIGMNRKHAQFVREELGRNEDGTEKGFVRRWCSRLRAKDWWWFDVFGPLIGYGYRPLRALYFSLGFIGLGFALFRIGYARGLMWPTADALADMKETEERFSTEGGVVVPRDYPRFNAFIYSLEAFVPLLELDQNESWRPNANRGGECSLGPWSLTTGGLLRMYLWFHIIVGWILTTLWVGAITGLVKG